MFILKSTHSLFKIPIEEKRHYFYAAIIQCISQSWKHICSKLLRKKCCHHQKAFIKIYCAAFFSTKLVNTYPKRNYYYLLSYIRLIWKDNIQSISRIKIVYTTVLRFVRNKKKNINNTNKSSPENRKEPTLRIKPLLYEFGFDILHVKLWPKSCSDVGVVWNCYDVARCRTSVSKWRPPHLT